LEIGAGLGPLAGKIWRFGLMGYSCKIENVMLCLSALGSALADAGHPGELGRGEAAAHEVYAAKLPDGANTLAPTRGVKVA
jgi:alanine-glyoxylate transaminase/serine-glyoxylate transaminase/serine-pyruvate transaminase